MATIKPEGNRGQHRLSDLLNLEEKSVLVQWLGSETCVNFYFKNDNKKNRFFFQSLASGVCQLLVADSARQWTLSGTGVVCLVKDYKRRNYFVQFFDHVIKFLTLLR